jgi:hypothetical protein
MAKGSALQEVETIEGKISEGLGERSMGKGEARDKGELNGEIG